MTMPSATLTAGSELQLEWLLEANHPGDCAIYISYDEPTTGYDNGAASVTHWAKLADFVGCVDESLQDGFDGLNPPNTPQKYKVTLPPWLPKAEHAVLRWEWIAVHVSNDIEFFNSCVDVKVEGTDESPSEAFSKLSPVIAVSGTQHLPTKRSDYRNAYAGQYGPEWVVSPHVAVYSGTRPPSPPSPPPSPSPSPPPPSAPSPPPVLSPPPRPPRPPSPPHGTQLIPAEFEGTQPGVLTLARLLEFKDVLTTTEGLNPGTGNYRRAVHASGGAAGDNTVVSEGQGYGLMLAGIAVATLPLGHPRRPEFEKLGIEFFEG